MLESDERVKKQAPVNENPRKTPKCLQSLAGRLRIWIGLTLSIIFLYFAVRKVPLSDLVVSLANAELIWLAAALVLQIFALLPRAKRWLVILEPEGSFREAFSSQNIGYLFNNIFLLRVGEIARILVMARVCGISIIKVGTSVILERVLDVIFVTLGLLIALSGIIIPDGYLSGARLLIWLVGVVVILLILFVRFYPRLDRLFRSLLLKMPGKFTERILAFWAQALDVIKLFSDMKHTIRLLAWFLVSWLLSIALYWCTLRAFVPDPTILEVVLMISTLALSFLIPSSPGYLGVFQFVGQQALVIPFGSKYNPVTAFAIALTVHAIFYITTSLFGIIGVGRIGLSISNIRKEVEVHPIRSEVHDKSTHGD
jgi:uncharacterized protein (TIRG00374 family)